MSTYNEQIHRAGRAIADELRNPENEDLRLAVIDFGGPLSEFLPDDPPTEYEWVSITQQLNRGLAENFGTTNTDYQRHLERQTTQSPLDREQGRRFSALFNPHAGHFPGSAAGFAFVLARAILRGDSIPPE